MGRYIRPSARSKKQEENHLCVFNICWPFFCFISHSFSRWSMSLLGDEISIVHWVVSNCICTSFVFYILLLLLSLPFLSYWTVFVLTHKFLLFVILLHIPQQREEWLSGDSCRLELNHAHKVKESDCLRYLREQQLSISSLLTGQLLSLLHPPTDG